MSFTNSTDAPKTDDAPDATPTTPTTDDKPKQATPSRRSQPKQSGRFKSGSDVTLSQLVNAVAASRKTDSTRAGKLTRSFIRGHYEDLRKGSNGLPKWSRLQQKDNRDGNRYPAMPASVANALLDRMSKGRAAK